MKALGDGASATRTLSTIGGGSLPGETLPSWAIAIDCGGMKGGAEALAKRLRDGTPPVLGRIEEERVLLDPRTVLEEEEEPLLQTVSKALG